MERKLPKNIIGLIAGIREAANLLIERELQRRGLIGVVPAHGLVFSFLFRQEEPVPIKALVERSGRVKSTVTGMINTLERHGYLYKQACADDGRSTLIGLTDKGKAIRQDFEEISTMLETKVYGDLVQEDRQRVMEILETISHNLRQ